MSQYRDTTVRKVASFPNKSKNFTGYYFSLSPAEINAFKNTPEMSCNAVDCITEEENRVTRVWTFARQRIPSWNIALITTIESSYRHQLLNIRRYFSSRSEKTKTERHAKEERGGGWNRDSCQLVGDSSRMHYEASMWIFRPPLNSHFPAEKWCVASVDANLPPPPHHPLPRLFVLYLQPVCATGYLRWPRVCAHPVYLDATFIFAGIFIRVPSSYVRAYTPGSYDACAWKRRRLFRARTHSKVHRRRMRQKLPASIASQQPPAGRGGGRGMKTDRGRDDRSWKNGRDVPGKNGREEERRGERGRQIEREQVGSPFAPASLTEARASWLKEIGRSAARKEKERERKGKKWKKDRPWGEREKKKKKRRTAKPWRSSRVSA